MKLKILTHPNALLRQRSNLVASVDEVVQSLCKDMIDTMRSNGGCGLAANQVGVLKRVFVTHDSKHPVFINPHIIQGYGTCIENEGCLSIPNETHPVKRHVRVRVKALDYYGKEFYVDAEGLLAKIIQHEIDHLNGKLIIDYEINS